MMMKTLLKFSLLMYLSFDTECFQLVKIRPIKDYKRNTGRYKRDMDDKIPDHLEVNLEGIGHDEILKLTRLPGIPTYIFTGNELQSQNVDSKDSGIYSINGDKGIVIIRRNNTASVELTGEIHIKDHVFDIEPYDNNQRRNRQLDTGYHKLHQKLNINRRGDFRKINHSLSSFTEESKTRYKRHVKRYTIELCFISDAEDYDRFQRRNGYNYQNTLREMKIYYTFVAEQIQLRYASTYERDLTFVIQIVITGLIILKERLRSLFLERIVENNGNRRGILDFNKGLDAATEWLYRFEHTLPVSDHYMFFTAYDLADKNDLDSLGLTNFGGMCSRDENGHSLSVSIIENSFDGNVGATAAHELGHSLNADHDSDAGCSDDDLFLMSERSLHPRNPKYASRPWKFSECSVKDIKDFLENEDVKCLKEDGYFDIFGDNELRDGEFYDLQEQCQMAFGKKSRFCKEKYKGKSSNKTFCYKIYCKNTRNKCEPIFPRDYTRCSHNHWCFKGQCIPRDNKEIKLEKIPFIIPISHDSREILPQIHTTRNSSDEITYNYHWKPKIANDYFHFNISNGRITVRDGALIDIQEAVVIFTATDGIQTTQPKSITIQIFDESFKPHFAQDHFVIEINSREKYSAIIPHIDELLSKNYSFRPISYQIQPSKHSEFVRIYDDSQIFIASDYVNTSLGNFTFTIGASFKGILWNYANVTVILPKLGKNRVESEVASEVLNRLWEIPVITLGAIATLSFIVFLVLKCKRQPRQDSSSTTVSSIPPLRQKI